MPDPMSLVKVEALSELRVLVCVIRLSHRAPTHHNVHCVQDINDEVPLAIGSCWQARPRGCSLTKLGSSPSTTAFHQPQSFCRNTLFSTSLNTFSSSASASPCPHWTRNRLRIHSNLSVTVFCSTLQVAPRNKLQPSASVFQTLLLSMRGVAFNDLPALVFV